MKLTEKQLAQIFQSSKDTAMDSVVDDLNQFSEASAARLDAVEKISNNSTLSASHQILNNFEGWRNDIATGIQAHIQSGFRVQVLKWLRPTVALAAVVTAVYFITPIKQQPINPETVQISHQLPTQKPDRIMYSSSFEKAIDKAHSETKSDVIAKFDFS